MKSFINEALAAISSIEDEIYETTNMEYLNLSFTSKGFYSCIEFLGIRIWDSESDEREYDEITGNYEPIETYLRKVINQELTKLKKIQL